MIRKRKSGYMLIEVILSIALITSFYVYHNTKEDESDRERAASLLGRKMTDVLHAIDKRVMLDGRQLETINTSTGAISKGNWNKNWNGITAFVDQMILQELVSSKNPNCGVPSVGWKPKPQNSEKIALIECGTFESTYLPFQFDIKAERKGHTTDPSVLKEWTITLFNKNQVDFKNNLKLFPKILNAAKEYDTLNMSGTHRFNYVDVRTGRKIKEAGDCSRTGFYCGIEFSFINSSTIYASEEGSMRRDGENAMMNDLVFSSDAERPIKCFSENGVEQNCGFIFDEVNGRLQTNVDNVVLDNIDITSKEGNVKLLCSRKEGGKIVQNVCGAAVVDRNGSKLVSAHFDKLYSDRVFAQELELFGGLIVRESLNGKTESAKYNNLLNVGHNSISRQKGGSEIGVIKFDTSGVTVDTHNKTLGIKTKDVELDESKIVGSGAATHNGRGLIIDIKNGLDFESDNLWLKKNIDTTGMNTSTMYVDKSKIATTGIVYKGVRIVGVNHVSRSGVSIPKAQCPSTPTGSRPSVKAVAYPSNGMPTNFQNSKFIPNPCLLNKNGNMIIKNKVIGGRNQKHVESICDDYNLKSRLSYGVSDSGNSWKTFMRWNKETKGGGNNVDGYMMVLIQYCEY